MAVDTTTGYSSAQLREDPSPSSLFSRISALSAAPPSPFTNPSQTSQPESFWLIPYLPLSGRTLNSLVLIPSYSTSSDYSLAIFRVLATFASLLSLTLTDSLLWASEETPVLPDSLEYIFIVPDIVHESLLAALPWDEAKSRIETLLSRPYELVREGLPRLRQLVIKGGWANSELWRAHEEGQEEAKRTDLGCVERLLWLFHDMQGRTVEETQRRIDESKMGEWKGKGTLEYHLMLITANMDERGGRFCVFMEGGDWEAEWGDEED